METLVTGSAGFIGFHVSKALLEKGESVIGLDNMNDYYSQQLKIDRNSILEGYEDFNFNKIDICVLKALKKVFEEHNIDRVCHLAAQAGVRYSIKDPHVYQKSNLEGFTNIIEMAKYNKIENFVYASSSSVYGNNKNIPYSVDEDVTRPISYYAATKVANEVIAYSYSHLYDISCTGLRFFTVYGPWGRPDMAVYKFTENIMRNKPIKVYNYGKMKRDFTYIEDIVDGVLKSLETPFDYEIFNLGNSNPVGLLRLIEIIEDLLGKEADLKMKDMVPGEVKVTYADISKSKEKLDYEPKIGIEEGIERFIEWYKGYH